MLAEEAAVLCHSRGGDDECRQDDRHAKSLNVHLSLQVCCHFAQFLTCGYRWRCKGSIPLSVRFRRFKRLDRNRFAGQIRIHYFAGRLLTIVRVLTNAAVLAVVTAALVCIVVGLVPVKFNKPLITVVPGGRLVCWQFVRLRELASGADYAGKTTIFDVGKL